ncbi:valyl-tRNA synthetase [Alkaliphilus metalliredigens QYMF]|uniref:Valine--tRNA ligase n=1 Tax=Alkaliphilus metalliredigens (strain QYMF) TaxID=293826 RepID=A6TN34_ALKMQ|nr:valine--tRNA ligase [Alkaliphilus metalliredigens]ABR47602.1 valyl-tRNA synthetase [Alkaliphilus metalliredigens QYMF]
MIKNLDKNYQPQEFEDRIYKEWENKGYFKPVINPDKESYSIVLPPPNITGQLHMGHALDHTLQDILIRWKRMQGFETLWQPGTDHASIATEVKVVEKIKREEGLSKLDIGRDGFLQRAWEWRDEHGRTIVNQMKRMGDSCDWSRERFTMDEGCNEAVTEVFIKLYEKGLIYRGNRIINWCPECKTSLSDAEVEHEDKAGHFWHIQYPIKDTDEYIEIATTRPETMLGDTGIAVHPEDERYNHLIGKFAILPLLDREIPIFADEYVDPEFGTGAVKITPAHDPNDFEIGARHNLEQIVVMNDDATINKRGGKYEGMARYDARKQIVKDLDALGQLAHVKDHQHSVGQCYRCNTIVEPLTSDQWFVKMEPLAKPAIEAVKEKEIQFVPERFSKTYTQWLENIRDWCISRQLWWGHRIPAYYCQDCGEVIVSKTTPTVCGKCQGNQLKQDEDVLDTWFSSALWPFSTLGWPEKTAELDYFYPTDVLVTGYDIIFFWVVRMAFSGLEFMDEIPFKHVFIHGLVRDADGRKMSKSLGNGIDPLNIIDQYGADALRFTLVTGNSPGNDMRFHMEKLESSRNFANKLWNATRFVLMNLDEKEITEEEVKEHLNTADRWIISRVNQVTKEVTENMDKFELGMAAQKIYDFIWSEYCDWYIELTKTRLYGENEDKRKAAQYTLTSVLADILKLLHPFMPFITEEIWQHLPTVDGSVIIAAWPTYEEEQIDDIAIGKMELLMNAIKNIRNVRAEMNVVPSRKAKLMVLTNEEFVKTTIQESELYFGALASVSTIEFVSSEQEVPDDAVSAVVDGAKLFIPLDDLIDFEKEIQRLEKEKEKLEDEITRVTGKLANQGFVAKAPAHLIETEKEKQVKYQQMLDAVDERLVSLKNKA